VDRRRELRVVEQRELDRRHAGGGSRRGPRLPGLEPARLDRRHPGRDVRQLDHFQRHGLYGQCAGGELGRPRRERLYTLPPCRIADTRDPAGTYGGPHLSANTERVFPLVGQCGIPAGARAVALNVTVTNSTGAGHLTFHPAGTPLPTSSTINVRANRTRANNAAQRLSVGGDLAVFCGMPSGFVDFVLDVVGYFQ
jgi:hypothetical protein